MGYRHTSVMPEEVMTLLQCRPGHTVVDGTLGGAGHARLICRRIGSQGTFVGIDQDQAAISNASAALAAIGPRVHLVQGNFSQMAQMLSNLQIPKVHGILLDLGVSSFQIDQSGRGFTFQKDEPLDMRMDVTVSTKAADLVNRLAQGELSELFFTYGEERFSKAIARRIVEFRKERPIERTGELVKLIRSAIPRKAQQKERIHPATRVFMALRLAVNKELESLTAFLDQAPGLLETGGRLCILAFHSLEDRIVKQRFRKLSKGCTCPPRLPYCVCHQHPQMRVITKKALRPAGPEIDQNPRSRSTRLRVAEKL
jgi:16S rRNA (cytosine1402-N4)-methyltransferase